jgi:hypothetical protein
MHKFAAAGQLEALMQLGIPPESLAELGLIPNLVNHPDETMGLTPTNSGGGGAMGEYPLPYTEMREGAPQPGLWNFIRHAAPAAGGAVGAGLAAMTPGTEPLAKRLLKGFLSGAGVASIPNILSSGAEALQSPR